MRVEPGGENGKAQRIATVREVPEVAESSGERIAPLRSRAAAARKVVWLRRICGTARGQSPEKAKPHNQNTPPLAKGEPESSPARRLMMWVP